MMQSRSTPTSPWADLPATMTSMPWRCLHPSCRKCRSDPALYNRHIATGSRTIKKNVRNKNRDVVARDPDLVNTPHSDTFPTAGRTIVQLLGGCSSVRMSFSTHHRTKCGKARTTRKTLGARRGTAESRPFMQNKHVAVTLLHR